MLVFTPILDLTSIGGLSHEHSPSAGTVSALAIGYSLAARA
jgi:hypothetical protein